MTAVISVNLREPQFEGQTKAKLGNPEARTAVESVFGRRSLFLGKKIRRCRAVVSKVLLALKSQKSSQSRQSVLRKGVFGRG